MIVRNRYNLEYSGSKYNTFYALVKSLVAAGVPIDGVGFQGHLIVGSVPGKCKY
jgi:endo-1,4-beta-xylanase